MADGEIRVKLDEATKQRLEAVAETAGQSVGDYVRKLIEHNVVADRFAEAHAAFAEYDRNGVSYDAETEMAEFVKRVSARLRKG